MTKENTVLNPIPMRTWRWLGVNEARFSAAEADRVVGIYHKEPLALSDGVRRIEDLPAVTAGLAAKIEAGVSEETQIQAETTANSGYWIEIGANEKRPEPIVLQYALDEENNVLVDRHLILAREGSEATVVIVYEGGSKGYHNGLLKVYAEKGATVRLVKVQLLANDAVHIDAVGTYAEAGARIEVTTVDLGAARTASSLRSNLAGDGSCADIEAIYFGDGQRRIDMNYILRHEGRRTDGSMQVRGALLDACEKTFRGTLDFVKGSKGSVGRENEEIVLLSPAVRNRSVPLMLSGEDDVDGHHAVSVGKMNEEKLFYLMSRGLSLREAEKLVIEASFQPALARVADDGLRQKISDHIRRRLAHVE